MLTMLNLSQSSKKYGSINEAERDIGVAHGSIRYWLKSNNPKAKIITREEYLNG